ncbi:hypothetical protein BZA77DRAFT_306442 [Pyronema omphalodes]|nr:hypothetical protein BZA77DRAFT_306442 [Pyronema omphalodes]
MNHPPSPKRKHKWGDGPNRPCPPAMAEFLLPFPDPDSLPRADTPSAKLAARATYTLSRQQHQRHLLINRHQIPDHRYFLEKLYVHDSIPLFSATSEGVIVPPSILTPETAASLSSSAAKIADEYIPVKRRHMLLSNKQVCSASVSSMGMENIELAARLANIAVMERRTMLQDEADIRWRQMEEIEKLYAAQDSMQKREGLMRPALQAGFAGNRTGVSTGYNSAQSAGSGLMAGLGAPSLPVGFARNRVVQRPVEKAMDPRLTR